MSYVYLLTPKNKLYADKKNYIGFTTNLTRRLRQHNRIIKGGAKKTKQFHPWNMVCYVSGFKTTRDALKFEYMWQHPKHVKRSRDLVKRVRGRAGTIRRKLNELHLLFELNEASHLKIHLVT